MARRRDLPRCFLGLICLGLLLSWGSAVLAAGDEACPPPVVGLDRVSLTPDEREVLRRWGFVVTRECRRSIHGFYAMIAPRSPDAELPVFITVDALLHAHHTVFESDIERLEKQNADRLLAWHKALWEPCVRGAVPRLGDKQTRRLCGLVAVGRRLMDPEWQPPSDAPLPNWVNEEVARARNAHGRLESPAWERQVEYSVFRPRGFYTQDARLQRYFQAWTWWSRFPLRVGNDDEMHMAEALTWFVGARAEYRTLLAFSAGLLNASESPDIRDLARALFEACAKANAGEAAEDGGLNAAITILKNRFHPVIRTGYSLEELSKPGELFGIYILAPAYTFDSEVFTLTTEGRLMSRRPGGLDLMAALNGPRIEEILLQETPADLQGDLRTALKQARNRLEETRSLSELAQLTCAVWRTLTSPQVTPRHPPFMNTDAYRRKSLQTALAGWAEHRHRWILHVQSSASGGGRISPPGFVEPNVPFWASLLDLTVATRESLARSGLVEDPRWGALTATVLRCRRIAEKQLDGQPLSSADVEMFEGFGDVLGRLLGIGTSASRAERPESVIADVHFVTDPPRMVHVGTGLPQAVYAVFPHEGKNWLCKGGVMTYRECVTQEGEALTDERWHAMLTSDTPPPQPEWIKDFCLPPNVDANAVK